MVQHAGGRSAALRRARTGAALGACIRDQVDAALWRDAAAALVELPLEERRHALLLQHEHARRGVHVAHQLEAGTEDLLLVVGTRCARGRVGLRRRTNVDEPVISTRAREGRQGETRTASRHRHHGACCSRPYLWQRAEIDKQRDLPPLLRAAEEAQHLLQLKAIAVGLVAAARAPVEGAKPPVRERRHLRASWAGRHARARDREHSHESGSKDGDASCARDPSGTAVEARHACGRAPHLVLG